MAIQPICDKCQQELREFGALLFSPPDENSSVKKFHICKNCYQAMAADMGTTSDL